MMKPGFRRTPFCLVAFKIRDLLRSDAVNLSTAEQLTQLARQHIHEHLTPRV